MEAMIEAIAKFGISAVTVGAGIWMLWYLVKHMVTTHSVAINKMSESVNKLTNHIEVFGAHVHREHKESADNQKEMLKQNQELTIQMREVTNALGRINGYKSH